jgi:hypothetical protein
MYVAPSVENYILVSNHKNSVRIENSDRRFFVLDVSEEKVKDFKYFESVAKDAKDK